MAFARVLLALLVAGCTCERRPCDDVACDPGLVCVDGACEPPRDAMATDGGGEGGPPGPDAAWPDAAPSDASAIDAGCVTCGATCCGPGERCLGAVCALDLGPCASPDDCDSDAYCHADGRCAPFDVPPGVDRDEACVQELDVDAIVPAVQCAFTAPPPGDPFPLSVDVRGTPVVVDFDLDEDPSTLRPSIVFQTFAPTGTEVLRVIDGATCALQHTVGDGLRDAATPALGDLDGDGRAEIVVNTAADVARAYRYDPVAAAFVELWSAASCDGGGGRIPHVGGDGEGSSPSLHDLDGDGSPEVILGGSIYGADGCLRASLGPNGFDLMPVVADVDEDGALEIVSSRGVFRLDLGGGLVDAESYFSGTPLTTRYAFAAVADLADRPLPSLGGDRAEVVVVAEGEVRVETLTGERLLTGALPSGRGGPPTIADLDGDGRPEIALAARQEYVVFDLDCLAGGDPAGCNGQRRTDGRLWSVAVEEQSSGLTGSSVFDFDADGQAEVVYHDECFVRIFRGLDGEVLFSFPRSSLTWFETPIVVDADGDFHSEIVLGAHERAGTCPAFDPYAPSVAFAPSHGIYVLRDARDRWAASRPVWNQHAYAVTHVGDHGEIPARPAVNHRVATLNSFRQNVQGGLEARGVADLTASFRGVDALACDGGVATITARVCNRGQLPLAGGYAVATRAGAPDGPELCRATVDAAIAPGVCVEVRCEAPAPDGPVDLYVVPDPEDAVEECHEGNSRGVLVGAACAG